jgi:hypothetical protein
MLRAATGRVGCVPTRVVHVVGDGVIAGEAGASAGVLVARAAIGSGPCCRCVRHPVTPSRAAGGTAALEGVEQPQPVAHL